VKGIGPKTQEELIKKLKSVKRIQSADLQTLISIIGVSKGKVVYQFFHPNDLDIK